MEPFKITQNKDSRLCCAYRCTKKRTSKDRFCSKHSKRYQKFKNPIRYAFHNLKANAKRRGKGFNLTLEEFEKFCIETNYHELTGKKASSASIDRIDPNKGYSLDNIQILSLSENSKKYTDCPF